MKRILSFFQNLHQQLLGASSKSERTAILRNAGLKACAEFSPQQFQTLRDLTVEVSVLQSAKSYGDKTSLKSLLGLLDARHEHVDKQMNANAGFALNQRLNGFIQLFQ